MTSSSDPSLLINQVPVSLEFPEDQGKFRDNITNYLRRMADSVNSKDTGLYSLMEYYSGKQYFTNFATSGQQNFRNVYRKMFDLVALNGGNIPAGGTVAFPHNITNLFQSAGIQANYTTNNQTYASVMGSANVNLDAVNVNFTNPEIVPLVAAYVVAEYLKN